MPAPLRVTVARQQRQIDGLTAALSECFTVPGAMCHRVNTQQTYRVRLEAINKIVTEAIEEMKNPQ